MKHIVNWLVDLEKQHEKLPRALIKKYKPSEPGNAALGTNLLCMCARLKAYGLRACNGRLKTPVKPALCNSMVLRGLKGAKIDGVCLRGRFFQSLGKTWAKNPAKIGPKCSVEGCKSRGINNELR